MTKIIILLILISLVIYFLCLHIRRKEKFYGHLGEDGLTNEFKKRAEIIQRECDRLCLGLREEMDAFEKKADFKTIFDKYCNDQPLTMQEGLYLKMKCFNIDLVKIERLQNEVNHEAEKS